MIYPLEVQNKIIGIIFLCHSQCHFMMDEEQSAIVERYVTHVANAIHNAQLFEDLRNTKMQLVETEKIANLTQAFETFVPQQFLRRIASEGIENIELGKANSEYVTVLFSDVRNFTTISETMLPQELLNYLNEYFRYMNKPIHENYGFIDKFIGDGIMAIFDRAGGSNEEEAENAILASIGMQKALDKYNIELVAQGFAPIVTGIGIHSGQVVIGTVGSEDRMDSTVLGDSVNQASRLEDLTKMYDCKIIISYRTLELLRDPRKFQYRELDWLRVKGKTQPMQIYEIYTPYPKEIQILKRKAGRFIRKGLFARKRKQWDEALYFFQKALKIYPTDSTALVHIQRCEKLREKELPEDWDGAIEVR